MIQFNLLPDVKLEYVNTQRTKRFLTLLSIVVSLLSIGIMLIAIVTVGVLQKKSLGDENRDIARYSSQLRGTHNLNKILTVQNQLNTLATLHEQKPVTSRLFTYISQVTPAQATLSELDVDFTANTLTIGGKAPSLDTVSNYTDTLKTTAYQVKGSGSNAVHAFSDVVLSNFGRDQDGATFTISCKFDPTIFNTNDDVTLTVPQSANASQSDVFQGGN